MIQIRKVQPKDVELLINNADKVSFNSSIMLEKLEHLMIVINGGNICGLGCGVIVGDWCLLNWIHIAEQYRRDLMGTALVKAIMNNAELSGAKTAYLSGTCDEFAGSLSFKKVDACDEINELKRLYESCYAENYAKNFYKVSLIDYFKPCSCK